MISDPNFRLVTNEAKLPGKIALSEHWTIELKGGPKGTHGEVERESLGGIRIKWVGTPKRVRLYQDLNIAEAKDSLELDLEISLFIETTATHPGLVQWIAVVKETDAGEEFHTLFDISGSLTKGGWMISARASAARFDDGRYRLCVQFNNDPKDIVLRSVRGRLQPHDENANFKLALESAPGRPGKPAILESPVQTAAAPIQPAAESEPLQNAIPPSPVSSDSFIGRLWRRLKPDHRVDSPSNAPPAAAAPARRPDVHQKTGRPAALPSAASTDSGGGKAAAANKSTQADRPTQVQRHPAPAVRPKVVIIAWEMSHNPVGRAYLLADMLSKDFEVELIGPLFSRYGSAVWPPVRSSNIRHRTFSASAIGDFAKSAMKLVEEIDADLVIACKPRMPSVLLAVLLKHRLGCPILIDVDDHELSFFNDAAPMSLRDARIAFEAEPDAAEQPYGELWTRLTETLIDLFDGRIASNLTLQRRFKGTIVKHARDENVFGPDRRSRARIRTEFGYSENDKVVLFLGTPRAHKGVFRIADALRRIKRDDLVLCVVGDPKDKRIATQLASYDDVRIDVYPDQPWARLPELIRLADCVCLLQDETSPIAQYQIPAKLTDALATGVPVAVTDVPPFADVPAEIVTVVRTDKDLDRFLKRVAEGKIPDDFVERARDYFIGELSYAANRGRLAALISQALQGTSKWRQEWSDFLGLVSDFSGSALPTATPSWSEERSQFPAISTRRPFDIAFFWKQNDTGIYGRRHDMMLKYLAQHPRVGRIIQFDAPMDIKQLHATARSDDDSHLDQGNLVVLQTVQRFLRSADTRMLVRRVFLHRGSRAPESFLGQQLPRKEDYVEWVRAEIERAGFTGPLVGWVTPTVFDFNAIHDAMNFSLSVADIIDDQRTFPSSASYRSAVIDSYAGTLQRVDLAFANCDATKAAFEEFRRDIHVIPNAAEPCFPQVSDEKPEQLATLTGPVIGYVGNLRDRIDVDLLELLSNHDPSWQIVLIGSAHRDPDVLRLQRLPNVHFLGVVPYGKLSNYIGHFDVAIMPHLDNEISKAMNPLKLYVYASAGVPTVTTDVANIGEVSDYAVVAKSADEFVAAVQRLIGTKRQSRSLQPGLTWPARVSKAIELIDSAAHCVPAGVLAPVAADRADNVLEPASKVA